jgi:hypothetical protein
MALQVLSTRQGFFSLGKSHWLSFEAFGGGGGGFSMVTCVEPWAVRPRESVQVAPTVTLPGATLEVFNVAEVPLPETFPLLAVQFATETGTLSGLVQVAERLTVPPAWRLVGLAETEMLGGFLGGNGLMV